MVEIRDIALDAANMMMRECLCMRAQKASRTVGRRFDEELRPLAINNWQLTIMLALSQQAGPTINGLAAQLGMVRTNLTKNLKPLERRGLLAVSRDEHDARVRRIVLSDAGRDLMEKVVPRWKAANDAVAAIFSGAELPSVRMTLEKIADFEG